MDAKIPATPPSLDNTPAVILPASSKTTLKKILENKYCKAVILILLPRIISLPPFSFVLLVTMSIPIIIAIMLFGKNIAGTQVSLIAGQIGIVAGVMIMTIPVVFMLYKKHPLSLKIKLVLLMTIYGSLFLNYRSIWDYLYSRPQSVTRSASEIGATDSQKTIAAVPDGTTDEWETHVYALDGFSLKLPKGWNITDGKIGPKNAVENISEPITRPQKNQLFTFYKGGNDLLDNFNTPPDRKINGRPALKVINKQYNKETNPDIYSEIIFLVENDRRLVFINSNPENEQLFDRVLVDIVFFPVIPVESPGTWQTFIVPETKISFTYPSGKYRIEKVSVPSRLNEVQREFIAYKGYSGPLPVQWYMTERIAVIPDYRETDTFSVMVFQNPDHLTITEWYKKYEYFPVSTNEGGAHEAPETPITTSGFSGNYGWIYGQEPEYSVFIPNNDTMILVTLMGKPSGDDLSSKILSTLTLSTN